MLELFRPQKLLDEDAGRVGSSSVRKLRCFPFRLVSLHTVGSIVYFEWLRRQNVVARGPEISASRIVVLYMRPTIFDDLRCHSWCPACVDDFGCGYIQ